MGVLGVKVDQRVSLLASGRTETAFSVGFKRKGTARNRTGVVER